jgi:hypothetical protein
MAHGFFDVPDWFSSDNQGAGIAIAGNDLVVLMVDHPGQRANRGLYRLGRALGAGGDVTGGWTEWIDIPDWFSWDNQGADVAVADLFNNGGRDMIVLMVDNAPQQNQGLYRIGRGLDGQGNVTGGWTPWIAVPDWFSWENQGAGVWVTPRDGQGKCHLIVFMIDDPPTANRGLYRIGRDLAADGTVQGGWSAWTDVAGWFSWDNQGGGIATIDLARNGSLDLVSFQIDNATPSEDAGGKNEGFFRIDTGLSLDGPVAAPGVDWLGVPHWFSWENQYGSIAIAERAGTRKLFVLMVDNPDGQNAGFYTVMDLDQDAATYGKWEQLPFHSGVLAVHAALLPTGDVLFFAGSGSSETRFRSPDFGDVAKNVPVSVMWTPPDNSFFHPATPHTANGRPFDMFCGGDAFLPDGRMLSAGGTQDYNNFKGRADAIIFDPKTRQWSFTDQMEHARWYPSLLTLGDGRVLATTGLDAGGAEGSKNSMEAFTAETGTWKTQHFANGASLPLYAHLFLMQDGRIFFSGGRMDDPMNTPAGIFDLTGEPVPFAAVPDLQAPFRRNQSASVILPPAQDQRVMVSGGGPPEKEDITHATDLVSIIDLKVPNPAYSEAMPMALGRMHLNLVLLPDRTVFVSGGSLQQESAPLSRLQSELFDPTTGAWRLMATASVTRLYHSTALLLPDGRVIAAGGNPEGGTSVTWEPPDKEEEMRLEIFSPPYLFHGPRPEIRDMPEQWKYGETVTIASPQAGQIKWISLVRNGVTTHSFDNGQRLVDVPIVSQGDGNLKAEITGNPNLAPPGWYMVFLVNQQGVPSVARWVQLSP